MPHDALFEPLVCEHSLAKLLPGTTSYTWTNHSIQPFDELIISWNAARPIRGHYVVLASVFYKQWSPWLLYAVWGSQEQYSFHETVSSAPVRTYQDQVELLEGHHASGFRIRVEACNGANLDQFTRLYASTCLLNAPKKAFIPPKISFELPIAGISQLALQHPRAKSLCSPTSATAVVRYLTKSSTHAPLTFASKVYDAGFDIYGNWTFSSAQTFVELGPLWRSYCARMPCVESVLDIASQGFPVAVSVKGPLSGSLKSYANGHLLVVRGYCAQKERVLCMDPAFLSDEETLVGYPLHEFIQAWEKRHNLAYIALPSNS